MFFHIKYNFISSLRTKIILFWTLIFPIALSTFMFLAFGNIFETTEKLDPVPVTVIYNESNEIFDKVLKEVSKEGDDKLLDVKDLKEEEAKAALEEKEISGIIYVDKKISLTVSENGIEPTILSTFLNQYTQMEAAITDIAMSNPANLPAAIDKLQSDTLCYEEIKLSDGNYDNVTNFFYATFAMSCLFACFTGIMSILNLQANLSALGARRSVSPTKKSVFILSQFISNLVFHFVIECISFMYMKFVLGIDFGTKTPAILLLLLMGSCAGISLGMLIGALPKPKSDDAKVGIGTAVSMVLSILADLCSNGIQISIEHTFPLLNRINPATLITDSFYALNTFDNYTRYTRNISCLALVTVILLAVSISMIRRNRYASI